MKTSLVELAADLHQVGGIVEVLTAGEQVDFAAAFVPWSIESLEGIVPKFNEQAPEHCARHGILAVLKLLAICSDALRPFLEGLIKVLLGVLREDNEDNAMAGLYILIDLHKIHRAALESHAQAMVDFVLEMFERFPGTCESIFDLAAKGTSKRRGGNQVNNALLKGMASFKVLIECPVVIVLLFQLHRWLVSDNIAKFVPLVIRSLGVVIERPAADFSGATLPKTLEQALGGSERPLTAAFAEYISAQVKTLSFLAYILRGFAQMLRPYHTLIPSFIIRLLKDCPPECASSRKVSTTPPACTSPSFLGTFGGHKAHFVDRAEGQLCSCPGSVT